jgi:hypothetical protein
LKRFVRHCAHLTTKYTKHTNEGHPIPFRVFRDFRGFFL